MHPRPPPPSHQACQTAADRRNSAVFDFPGVLFVIRPDPMRKYFVPWGWGRGVSRFSEKFQVENRESC